MSPERWKEMPTANLQFRIEPARIPWIYSVLRNQPQVELYNGDFPEPFEKLIYALHLSQNQLALVSQLQIGDEFKTRYGATVGSPEDLDLFFKRYPKHELSPNGTQLAVFDKKDQVQGVIARTGSQIIIQRGGGVGQLTLPKEKNSNPVNDLSNLLDEFSLLIQRYVGAIWKSSPETDKKKFQIIFDIPAMPEGALRTYFSIPEIIVKEFQESSRPVELNEGIGGYPDVKTAVENLFLNQTQPERSRSYGLQPYGNKSLLATGSEGTGKSLFPKALDKMLRDHYGKNYEYLRLPFADMLRKYQFYTVDVVTTVLEHIRENERKGVVTLLHFDNLEHLTPQHQRLGEVNVNYLSSSEYQNYYQSQNSLSDVELNDNRRMLEPIVEVIRQFGKEICPNSQYTIVYGESRVPREFLPEGIARTFRRTFSLDKPTTADVHDILRVQINSTKEFAQSTGRNPFVEDIESLLKEIAGHAIGLDGRSIQQAIVSIAARKNAERADSLITYKDICDELDNTRLAKGLVRNGPENRRLGFQLPY